MRIGKLEIKVKPFILSLVLSLGVGIFFYLLVLQLPVVSKSRLFICLLFSMALILPIYKTSERVWEESSGKFSYIVLTASFIGLFITNAFFYYPRASYLFYGQHEIEIVIDGQDLNDTQVEITALFTKLKSESYSRFQISGGSWKRIGNVFSTNSSESTRLTWKGWTGAEATIRFRTNPRIRNITLIWDGVPQRIELTGDRDELSFPHRFTPTVWGKIILWLLSTLVAGYSIGLLLWIEKKLKVYEVISTSLRLEQGKIKFIFEIVVIVVLFLSAINTFLPINPDRLIRDRDDGAFLYMGRQVLKGKVPYLELWDHKGPLIFYINAFGLFLAGGNEWGVWFIQIIWLFCSALLAYKVISELTGKIPALAGTYLLFVFIINPLYGGNYVEEYALLPLFLCWFGFQKFLLKNEHKWLLLVGFSTGMAILLRPNLISAQVGVSLVVLLYSLREKKIKTLYAIIIGSLFVLVPVLLYFYLNAALNEMFSAYYLYNRSYVGGSFSLLRVMEYIYKGLESFHQFFWLIIPGMVFLTFYYLISVSRSKKAITSFLAALFLGALAEIWLSNLAPFQYKQYYILWVAYFVMFSSFLVAWLIGALYKFINSILPRASRFLIPFTLWILFIGLTVNGLISNLTNHVLNPKEYPVQEMFADIRNYSDCCSFLLVWGAEPQINFALEKDSPSRFFYQYPLFNDNYATSEMISEFSKDVVAKKPLIIDTSATNLQVYPLSLDPSPGFSKKTSERLQPLISYIFNNYSLAHEMSNGWLIYLPEP